MKAFLDKLFTVFAYVIPAAIVGWVLIIIYQNHFNVDQSTELIKAIIWPLIVLVALFLFKKVVTYLFFSMEEFNFFGIKWGLKDIRQVIAEKAQEIADSKEREKQRLSDEEERQSKFSALEKEKNTTIEQWRELAVETLKEYTTLSGDYKVLQKEKTDLQDQLTNKNDKIQKVLAEIDNALQAQTADNIATNNTDQSTLPPEITTPGTEEQKL